MSVKALTAVFSLLLLAFVFPGPAWSQDGIEPLAEEMIIEEVVVTGSRVKRSNLNSTLTMVNGLPVLVTAVLNVRFLSETLIDRLS
jgi:hypothetical protein